MIYLYFLYKKPITQINKIKDISLNEIKDIDKRHNYFIELSPQPYYKISYKDDNIHLFFVLIHESVILFYSNLSI